MTTQDVWHRQPDGGLKRLSSKWTFFYKKVFPVLWFGIAAVFLALAVFALLHEGMQLSPPLIAAFAAPLVILLVGYVVMNLLIFDLLDEVWDGGDHLVFVNDGQRASVPFSNIINVNEICFMNPPRITLLLRDPCPFGREVSFSPVRQRFFLKFMRHHSKIGEDLLERVHHLNP